MTKPLPKSSSYLLSKQKSFLVIFAILVSTTVFSQRQRLEGKVGTSADIDIEGINIYNLSTQKGTVTDKNGAFSMEVGIKDSLSISAIHIQDTKLVIGEEQLKNKMILIHLSEKMNQLSTVTLRRPLTGYLGNDANIIPVDKVITATSMRLPNADRKLPSKIERQLYAANSGPVDMLVNALSGRTKMLRKHLEFQKTMSLTLALLDKFPETYFTEALKIDKLKIYSFIFFCEDDPRYKEIIKLETADIIAFLEKKSREFKK